MLLRGYADKATSVTPRLDHPAGDVTGPSDRGHVIAAR
jgi:hypothetical protein